MGFNLLELAKDQITGQLVKQATSALGESEGGIQKALGGILPSVLGSVIGKASDEKSAGGLLDMIKGVDPGILGNMGGLMSNLDDSKPDGIMNIGQGLLSGLMGNKLGGAVDLISKFSGIKSGSAMSLFKMATPFLMGMISKKVSSDGLGVSGLMSMLSDQKDSVSKALPAGMGGLMGLGNLLGGAKDMATGALAGVANTTKNVAEGAKDIATTAASTATATASKAADAATATAGKAASGGMSLFKWLIPALLGLAVIYFLTQSEMCKNSAVGDAVGSTIENSTDAVVGGAKTVGGAVVDGANTVSDAAVDGAKSVGAGLSAAFSSVNETAKSALSSIKFGANSIGQQMMTYIDGGGKAGDGTFRFNNLNFESGSAKIAGTTGEEVDNLAAILKAYPSVKVKVNGHTDSDGDADANLTLSDARANAVKARLGAQGIDGSRISTEGYGETDPVADNGTAEGKAQNRRIEVKIID